MINTWNKTIKAGETLRERFKLKDEDTKLPIAIAGATAICQIRKTTKSAESIGEPTIRIIDAANGEMEIEFLAELTAALPTTGMSVKQEDVWQWDAFITYADGSTECLWDGEFRVRPSATRRQQP